jgi:hypothetical protein
MWRYNNIRFVYSNPVDSVFAAQGYVPYLTIYVKSKFALMQALQAWVEESYLGAYTEIDQRKVSYDKPIKV